MTGINTTFETLIKTQNAAANDVLINAVATGNTALRHRALRALMARNERVGAEGLLGIWDQLGDDDIEILQPEKRLIAKTLMDELAGPGKFVRQAIDAARRLDIPEVIVPLVELAESHRDRRIRGQATDAVLDLVRPLGHEARCDRDTPTLRRPIVARLLTSVRCLSMHRNKDLVDAFLLVSAWSDAELRQALTPGQATWHPLLQRMSSSDRYGIVELLAGFSRRRSFCGGVANVLVVRDDTLCREALLRTVGNTPSTTTLRNIRDMGMPACCIGGERLMNELQPQRRAALAFIYIAAEQDLDRLLHILAAAVESGGPGCSEAFKNGLSQCDVPAADTWLSAVMLVAEDDSDAIQADDKARLLKRMIDLLDHADDGIVQGVRRLLDPLHASEIMPMFDQLDADQRRQLGRVVTMIDPNAIQSIRDGLRHPVLEKRIAAVGAAEALAVVDQLADQFKRISRDDHQDARIRAARAMGQSSGDTTMALLREMTGLPDCAARDAAVDAIDRRRNQNNTQSRAIPSW